MATVKPAVGFFQSGDLEDPERFRSKLPLARRYGGISKEQDLDAWAWRAHALRVGRKPLALFVWLMHHPDERRSKITAEDEDAARRCAAPQQRLPGQTSRERYEAFLRSPQWLWIRKLKLREAAYTCQRCGLRTVRGELQVHHKNYGRPWGKESFPDLEVLCDWCHHKEHPGMTWRGLTPIWAIVYGWPSDAEQARRRELQDRSFRRISRRLKS